MKSNTCLGKATGKTLTIYNTEFDAVLAAEYVKGTYGNDLVPYKCHKCAFWHLSPKSRVTPSKKCNKCTSSDGVYKNSYRTKSEAILRAKIIYEERGVELNTYKCKYGEGWHLTKSN
ncbi:hypothetical protein BCT86_09980 [Vibrio breoganii]|nr:hypothetical protein BCV08_14765 [Vibrio breoganii]PML07198.1 hypothetical protein BCT86_09980 [Vibrio breoganii]PML36009.1 hypothetical protein BCT78_10955 [Vibrio breoganii]PML92997.1 hypothetical protein BCT64_14910 [Vibrio breoganii]PMM79868.1 hypothetical protein BCT45_16060 [Vibrio breoganii]